MRENVERNYGMSNPEGYRKALRLAKQAEKFHRPIICFIDTPGAYPGIEAEESLQLRDARFVLHNLTNVQGEDQEAFADLELEGAVMGNAPLALSGRFDPNASEPKFDVNLALEGVDGVASVGEPLDPDLADWASTALGRPVHDTWWQTETGAIMVSTLPGVHATKPGSAGVPLFGVDAAVVDADGNEVQDGQGGYLVMRRPWPGMLRTVFGDDDRYRNQYWGEVEHAYFSGDGARRDEDGYFWIMGRVDDVVNVSGHRLGTMEVESALVSHDKVAEAAVVGRPDELKGQGIVAFVTLEAGYEGTEELRQELRKHVADEIGAIARPDEIRFAESLPKTRSGKIMRRLLRNVASGQELTGDISTLEDRTVVERLREEE